MVLVEGENADGLTVDEDGFDVNAAADAPTVNAADQVVSAILGTQEGAAESGYQLRSTGVTWTDPIEAAALRDALAARKVENVMLVSSFLAAAALAQVVGSSVGYAQTGLLFVEPDAATLAVVNTSDGSITDVHRHPLTAGSDSLAELAALASGAESLDTRPDGLFLVGSGVDIAPLKPQLEAATALIVSAPEEPETALARGAALASANAPLFSSSTAALAYAQDPGTGFINPYAIAPGYFDVATDNASGEQALAYSAVPDEDANAYTAFAGDEDFGTGTYTGVAPVPKEGGRRPLVLVASAVVAIFVVGAAALLVALAVSMRPTAGVRPEPGHNAVAPKPAPAAPAAPAPASAPAPAPEAPAPAPEAPAPEPAAPAPAPAAPAPAARAPEPAPAAPAPAPEPAAPPPAPAPVAPAPAPPPAMAPIPVPVPIPLPPIFGGPRQGPPGGPWGGDHGGGGWGHGGGNPGGGGGFPGGGHGSGGGGFGGGHGGFGGGGFGGHGGFGHGFGIPGLGF
ncbi:MAG TPA: hypothetical protein VGG53_18500 [Mycobacterium sp.]